MLWIVGMHFSAFFGTLLTCVCRHTRLNHRVQSDIQNKLLDCEPKKRRLWKQCVSSPSNLHLQWQYRECAHEFRTCCQQFTKQREEFVINTNSLGAFYRHVNSRIRRRNNIGVLIDEWLHCSIRRRTSC